MSYNNNKELYFGISDNKIHICLFETGENEFKNSIDFEIPEKIRQKLGINNDTKLSLKVENGQLILKPLQSELETYYEDGILVFKAEPIGNVEVPT